MSTDPRSTLASRIERVQEEVAAAARAAGRPPESVTIVAVSKTVDRETVNAAAAHGLRIFGENRVQDAARKFAAPLPPGSSLHLIGQLQTNKARVAVALFETIESVDRRSLIDALEKEVARIDKMISLLLQVNIAEEDQKSGCHPDEAADLLRAMRAAPHLEPRGLMTIAPLVANAEDARPVFAGLRQLRDRLQRESPCLDLPVLSMGMSNDYPIAIAEGATHVRIGRAIFGG